MPPPCRPGRSLSSGGGAGWKRNDLEILMSLGTPDVGLQGPAFTRRRFVQGLAAGGSLLALGAWPRQSWALRSPGQPEVLAGTQFDLSIGETLVTYTGKTRPAITITGSVPGREARWQEGTRVQRRVSIDLSRGATHGVSTSLQWPGMPL